MKQQIFSPVATVVSILFVGTTPVRAATIVFPDVVQASITRRGEFPRVHLSLLNFPSQGGGAVLTQVNSPTPAAADKTTPRSLTIIGSVPSQSGQDNRVTIDLGEVTGTICDCGEIILPPVAGGGFPKWPLLALAAIPVLFIGSDEDVDAPLQPLQPPSVQSLVPPAPPPQPIPEPATLLLFGTGLLALSGDARRRARRRRRGGDRAKQSDKATSTRDVTS